MFSVVVDTILFSSSPTFPVDSQSLLPEAVYESTNFPCVFAITRFIKLLNVCQQRDDKCHIVRLIGIQVTILKKLFYKYINIFKISNRTGLMKHES